MKKKTFSFFDDETVLMFSHVNVSAQRLCRKLMWTLCQIIQLLSNASGVMTDFTMAHYFNRKPSRVANPNPNHIDMHKSRMTSLSGCVV